MVLVFVISIAFFFLILRFCVTLFNFISNPKLNHFPRNFDDKVSIIVYEPLLVSEIEWFRSVIGQDYQNFEVLSYTSDPLLLAKQADPRVKVFGKQDFGNKSLNKLQAFHHLSKIAIGDYLLFIDGGLAIQTGLINNCIGRMKVHNLSVLSIFSDRQIRFNSQYSIWTLGHYLLLNLYPLRLIKMLPTPLLAVANRDFLFCEASFYYSLQPFSKQSGLDEIRFIRSVKTYGGKMESLLANGQLIRPVPTHFRQIGPTAKKLNELFGNSYLAMFICAFWLCLAPILILIFFNPILFIFYASLVLLNRLMVSLMSNQNPGKSLLYHPLSISMFGIIAFTGLSKSIRKK